MLSRPTPVNHSIRRLVALAGLALGSSAFAGGGQVFSEWIGPFNGNFSTSTHWHNLIVPDSPGEVFLLNGGTAQVNANITVDKFGLGGGTLNISPGRLVGVRTQTDNLGVTGIFGGGIIAMNSDGNQVTLRLSGAAGSYAIHGNSGNPTSILMSNTTANVIDGTATGITFVNEGLISGSGQIGQNGLILENTGTGVIQSSHIGGNLIIDAAAAGGMTNRGIVRSTGGTLTITGSTVMQLDLGELSINSVTPAILNVNASTIIGGRFHASGSSPSTHYMLMTGSSILDNVSIEGGTRIPPGHLCFIRNGFTTPGSRLFLDSDGNQSTLRMLNDVTLSGAGGIDCTNTTANVFDANVTNLVMTNNLLGGIRGSMQLGQNSLGVINNTFVESMGTSGLIIDPPTAVPFDNNGIIRATPGSPVRLVNGAFENTGGFFIAQHPSEFTLQNVRVDNGTLAGEQPGGVFQSIFSSVLANVTLTGSTILNLPPGHLTFVESGIHNQGVIAMNSDGNQSTMRSLSAIVNFTGGGLIAGTDTLANVIDANVTNQRMVNMDNTFRGSFQICQNSLQFVNNHLIEAQGSSGIQIDPPTEFGFENNSIVRALTGSNVRFVNGFVENDGALIEAQDGAVIHLQAAEVHSGTLRTLGSGSVSSTFSSALDDVALDTGSRLNLPPGHVTFIRDGIVNRGVIAMNSDGNQSTMRSLSAMVNLTGGGLITGTDTLANVIDANVTNQRMVNMDNTFRGSFQICQNSLQFVNNHLIEAQGSSGIQIDPPGTFGFENNSIVRALTGSNVRFVNGFVDNTSALIEARDGAAINLQNVEVSGGILRTLGTGAIVPTFSSVLANLTIDAGSTVNMPPGHVTHVRGTLINSGTIRLNSDGNQVTLRSTGGDITLTGGGTILCSNTTANVIDAAVTNQRLINENNTIRGAGQLCQNGLSITNRGSIIADASAGLRIDPPGSGSFVNDPSGVMRAESADITIFAGPFSTAGSVVVNPGRLIHRTSGTWVQNGGSVTVNGELQVDAGNYDLQAGALRGTGLVDANVDNSAGTLAPGASAGTLTIEGNYTQGAMGTLEFEVGGIMDPSQNDTVNVIGGGSATLNGTIRISRLNDFVPPLGQGFTVIATGANLRFGTFTSIDSPDFWHIEYLNNAAVAVFDGVGPDDCLPDFNNDGNLDPDDLGDFINCYFSMPPCPEADFNNDGNIDPDDLGDFINAYFAGC
ncbi:MAG: hypothetical protein AB7K52_15095 [Phycisphaerales bacterium]